MKTFSDILVAVDDFVWGPVMLVLLVGTGIFLTIRTRALCWRNLPYALKSVLSKEARQKTGEGDVSPFSALTTALAATIGTGNIVGVATAMVSGGPGALVWMWISAAFGLTSKFSECMLAIKYREVNEKGEMSGGPMYTMKKGFKNKKAGAVLGWLFAFFAVVASFGIGNMTQGNSISTAINSTFGVPTWITGIVITVLAMFIILGGIKSISKVSQVVVPVMAIFYIIAALVIIIGNIQNLPAGIAMIFKMAFSIRAVGGGLCGSIVASMMQAMRFGVARGVFSNEAGMGSAAITAAAATTTDPVRQAYINMTGTFWDTIVVCTLTGLVIASSGVLGATTMAKTGTYTWQELSDGSHLSLLYTQTASGDEISTIDLDAYEVDGDTGKETMNLSSLDGDKLTLTLTEAGENAEAAENPELVGTWEDSSGNEYIFSADGSLEYRELVVGSALTISAFSTVLGKPGAWLICIAIALFAFSTILGWEYHGEKAFEYLFGTHRYNIIYRVVFSLVVYLGATTTLTVAWNFSDIANALMAIPNLISMLVLSGVIVEEINRYQVVLEKEKAAKK
jgi:AGCS family alanine or glycine:cation symporter